MNSKLEIIENQFAEELLFLAEDLLAKKGIGSVTEMSKNLWIFKFPKENVEVEILFKSGVKTKYTCDCTRFITKDICHHVVAGLLYLRKEKTEKEALKAKKAAKAPVPQNNYNFKTILDQATGDDLRTFVHSYARKNSDFALAFKVHFASKTETGFEKQKYEKLLSEAVKPKTARHPKFTRKEWQNLKFLLNDFKAQIQDNLSQEQFANAFTIFERCQDKIAYVKYIYGKVDEKDILVLESDLLDEFKTLLKKDLAPEFRIAIEKTLVELALKSFYNPESKNFLSQLNEFNSLSFENKSLLIENFIGKLKSKPIDRDFRLALILELAMSSEDLKSLIFAQFSTLEIVESISKFQSDDRIALVDHYLNEAFLKGCGLEEFHQLRMKQFAIKQQLQELIDYFLEGSDRRNESKFLLLLKDHFSEKRIKSYKKEIKKIISGFSEINKAHFFAHFKMLKELITVIKKNKELSFVIQFDELLLAEGYHNELEKIYIETLTIYLDNHIGEPSREKLRALFFHLNKIEARSLRYRLKDYVNEEYPHRNLSKKRSNF